jgi:hypothetical protein
MPLSPFLLRTGTSLFALAVLGVFALLYIFTPGGYFTLLHLLGDSPYPTPFADTKTILDATACWRAGVDVYTPSACLRGGIFNYSPLLLRLAFFLPAGPAATLAGGLASVAAFILSLSLLPPPETPRALAIRCAAATSIATIFGVERGNFDLVIFCLVVLGVALTLRHSALRLAGYLFFLLAAGLKFYPAAALVLLAKEPRRPLLLFALPLALLGTAYILGFHHGTISALKTLPGGPPFIYWFGAINLPYGLSLLLHAPASLLTQNFALYQLALANLHVPAPIALAIQLPLWTAAALAMLFLSQRRAPAPALDPAARAFHITGAALTLCCFFAAQNVVYREIFLLLTLPALERDNQTPWLLPAILFLLWEETLRPIAAIASATLLPIPLANATQITFWLLRELLWWATITQLGATLVEYGQAEARRLLGGAFKQGRPGALPLDPAKGSPLEP